MLALSRNGSPELTGRRSAAARFVAADAPARLGVFACIVRPVFAEELAARAGALGSRDEGVLAAARAGALASRDEGVLAGARAVALGSRDVGVLREALDECVVGAGLRGVTAGAAAAGGVARACALAAAAAGSAGTGDRRPRRPRGR